MLHDQIPVAGVGKVAENFWQMGMRKGGKKGDLTIKRVSCFNDLARLEQAKVDLLDCHQAASPLQISSLIDRTKTALAYLAQNTIAPLQHGSGRKRPAGSRGGGSSNNLERCCRGNFHRSYWRGSRHSPGERGERSLASRAGY